MPRRERIGTEFNIRESKIVSIDGYGMCISASFNGSIISIGGVIPGEKGFIRIFDKNGKSKWMHKVRDAVTCIHICKDGTHIIAGSDDHFVYFFDYTGLFLWRYESQNIVKNVTTSSDGMYSAAGSADGNVYFFDRSRKIKKFVWKHKFDASITSICISDDGSRISSCSEDASGRFFDRSGSLLWMKEFDDSVNTTSMSMSAKMVAFGTNDGKLATFDINGNPMWDREIVSSIKDVKISDKGDKILCASESGIHIFDKRGRVIETMDTESHLLKCVTDYDVNNVLYTCQDRTVHYTTDDLIPIWKYMPQSPVWDICVLHGGDMCFMCGVNGLLIFESWNIFKYMMSQLKENIISKRGILKTVPEVEKNYNAAINALRQRKYHEASRCIHETKRWIEKADELQRMAEERRITAERAVMFFDKFIDDITSAARAIRVRTSHRGGIPVPEMEEDGEIEEIKKIEIMKKKAIMLFDKGEYEEVIKIKDEAEKIANESINAFNLKRKLKKQFDNLEMDIVDAIKYDVDTTTSEKILFQAKDLMKIGNADGALLKLGEARSALLEAKRKSENAIQHDIRRAREILKVEDALTDELIEAEELLANAVLHYFERKDFEKMGKICEEMAFAVRLREGEESTTRILGLMNAASAYLDAKDFKSASAVFKKMGDFRTAAKLAEISGLKEEAIELWRIAASMDKKVPPHDLDLKVNRYIESERYYDAAEIFASNGMLDEAVEVLRKEKKYDSHMAVFEITMLFNLNRFEDILKNYNEYISSVKGAHAKDISSDENTLHCQMLFGFRNLAEIIGDDERRKKLEKSLEEFIREHLRKIARNEIMPEDTIDSIVVYNAIKSRDFKRLERVINRRHGGIWDSLKTIYGSWKEMDYELFSEELENFRRFLSVEGVQVTQKVDDPLPLDSLTASLSQMRIFNVHSCIYDMLKKISSKEYLLNLMKIGDMELKKGNSEKAAEIYEKIVDIDNFSLVDSAAINLRLAGVYMLLGKNESAEHILNLVGATRDAAILEISRIRGEVSAANAAESKKSKEVVAGEEISTFSATTSKSAFSETSIKDASKKVRCPRCGNELPASAVRCFRCGEPI